MNTASIIVLVVIILIVVAVILKATVFKGPRWLRESKKNEKGSR